MSGGFSFGQSSGGFTFGQSSAAAPTAGFGMPAATTTAATAPAGGFSFGTPAQPSTNSSTTGGFSFGTPAQSTAAGGSFTFGTPTKSFGLGSAPQTSTAAAPALGSTAAPAPATGFTLGGGLPSQSTAAPAGKGFSFGAVTQAQQPAAAPAATTASTGFGGFSFGSTAQATPAAPAPAAASAAPTGGGFTFGSAAPSTLTLGSQPPAASTAATIAQSSFTLGIKPSTTPAPPATTQTAQSSAPSLFSLSAPAATSAPAVGTGFALPIAPTAIATSIAPAATTAAGGLSLMLKPLGAATTISSSTAATTAAASTTGASAGFTLGLKQPAPATTSTAAAAAVTTTATALSTAAAAPPVMSYAQLEGLINKWSLELEDQERHFLQQATQVNAWDRMLVENGEKITSLHKEMEKVKLDQRRLNQELDFILSQQKELEDLLCPLEESVKEQSGTIYMQNADEERERTYKLAENVDAQLKRMSQDLKEIIEHLNTSSGPADTTDPLQQICKILNAHMDSLQWIDQNSVLLQRRVEEVSKMCDNQRKEQEKTFRLTFD